MNTVLVLDSRWVAGGRFKALRPSLMQSDEQQWAFRALQMSCVLWAMPCEHLLTGSCA